MPLEDGRATGIAFWRQGEVFEAARARRGHPGSRRDRLTAASGAVRHRRGAMRWARRGIDGDARSAGVGENLQDHLQIRTVYKVKDALTLNERAGTLLGKAAHRAGICAARRAARCRWRPASSASSPDPTRAYETPNLQYHVQPLSLDRFGEPLHGFPAITASVANLRPDSRGSVAYHAAPTRARARRSSPTISRPKPTAGSRRDSIRLTRRLMAANALARFKPEEYLPGPGGRDR